MVDLLNPFASTLMSVLTFGSFSLPPLSFYGCLPMQKKFDTIFATKQLSFLDLKDCAWSQLSRRGTPLFEIYLRNNFMAISAVLFDTTFAVENFDRLSIANKMYASLFSSSG